MILNSQLALRIGLLRSTRNNFIWGAVTSLILCLVLSVSLQRGFISLLDTPFPYIFGGGWLGVLVVYACNWILPRIPTIYSALLLFSGQIITAIIIDTIRFETFSWTQLAGALLILAGMMYNIRIDARNERRSTAEQIIK
jgi:transporter family-2 protein